MARSSRGASRDWDAPLACDPSPPPVLFNAGFGQMALEAYDFGLYNESFVSVEIFEDGVFFEAQDWSELNVAEGNVLFLYDDGHTYQVRIILPAAAAFCPGPTPLSNGVDT